MKRKGLFFRGTTLFKWHVIVFIVFTPLAVYSIISEMTFPGNATVPFGVFRTRIIEKMSYVLVIGPILVMHYCCKPAPTRNIWIPSP